MKIIGILFITIFSSILANATIVIPTQGQLFGGSPTTSSFVVVAPTDIAYPHVDLKRKSVISLVVNHHLDYTVQEGLTTVKLTVKRWVNPFSTLLDTIVTLQVSYNPNTQNEFVDKQILELNGLYKYEVVLNEVNGNVSGSLPQNISVVGDLYIDRLYDFTSQTNQFLSVNSLDESRDLIDSDCDGHFDAMRIRWKKIIEAEEYQVEWAYVNDYTDQTGVYKNSDDVKFDFKHNSSRLSTTSDFLDISLIYDHGYIIYRVRAVGKNTGESFNYMFGLWSTQDKGTVTNVDSDQDANHFYLISDPWEINKNWQYSGTFAEEAKKKEVVSFFDGTLRNRQMVTVVSSSKKAIVGETIYDHQGRPAIQVLPTPVSDPECYISDQKSSLKYYKDFNVNSNGEFFSRKDFDISSASDVCGLVSPIMKKSSGASRYYSDNNLDQNDVQAFIPNANEYPFSQVEYTPDNTGRVRRQGGVGQEFQLNSGHESKYFYGQATQIELDRLFGSEVGDKSHYQKNMVMDPNKQVSISYLDQEGRVIATSLAGDSPSNLNPLESNTLANLSLEESMLTPVSNALSADGKSREFTSGFLVSSATDITLNYQQIVTDYIDACTAELCYTCLYDLNIDVKDECGISLITNGTFITGKFEKVNDEIQFSVLCDATTQNNMNLDFTLYDVPVGSYSIIKTLSINEEALAFYEEKYLDSLNNSCLITEHEFYEEFIASTDFTGCDPVGDCQECVDALGTLSDYLLNELGNQEQYYYELNECQKPCLPTSLCDSYLEMLKIDMSPSGQYGEYLTSTNAINPSIHGLSVFNLQNNLPRSFGTNAPATGIYDWQLPIIEKASITLTDYYEEDLITLSKIQVFPITFNSSGQVTACDIAVISPQTNVTYDPVTGSYFISPKYLVNVADFIQKFKASWAHSLIYYHPEYAYYKSCALTQLEMLNETISSEDFDHLMESTNTWEAAITNGLINSNWINGQTGNMFIDVANSNLTVFDPFVADQSIFLGFGTQFNTELLNFKSIGGVQYSMVEVAAMINRCGNPFGTTPSNSCYHFGSDVNQSTYGSTVANDQEVRDADWVTFKSLYLSLKKEYWFKFANHKAINDPQFIGYNACIENENFNPFENSFFTTFIDFSQSPFFNHEQPCSIFNLTNYRYKNKRFKKPSDLYGNNLDNLNQIALSGNYELTGICPSTQGFSEMLSELAIADNLDNSGVSLVTNNGFSMFMIHQSNPPNLSPIQPHTWNTTLVNATHLEATVLNTGTYLNVEITQQGPLYVLWDDIEGIEDFNTNGIGGLGYTFSGKFKYTNNGSINFVPFTGSVNFNLESCSFLPICKRTSLGFDFLNLVSGIFMKGSFFDVNFEVSNSNTSMFLLYTNQIATLLSGTSTPNSAAWSYNSSTGNITVTGSESLITLNLINTAPLGFNNWSSVTNLSVQSIIDGNSFILQGTDVSGNIIVQLEYEAFITKDNITNELIVGNCELPSVSNCTGNEQQNYNDLVALFSDVLLNQTAPYDLMVSPFMTENLLSQLNSNGSSPSITVSGVNEDGLQITDWYLFSSTTENFPNQDYVVHKIFKKITATAVIIQYEDCYYTYYEIPTPTLPTTGYEMSCTVDYDTLYRKGNSTNTFSFNFGGGCDLDLTFINQGTRQYASANIVSIDNIAYDYAQNGIVLHCNFTSQIGTFSDDIFVHSDCLPVLPCEAIENIDFPDDPIVTVPFEDPCTQTLTNIAQSNASNAYNQQVDDLLTAFRNNYITHCMGLSETLTRTYNQSEHHYTLYYYDQAGNLIKTIPPEGVEPLDITSYSNPLSVAVNLDRNTNSQNVVTGHRMATTYKYNSLNQLIAQHMPDQDDFSHWEQNLTNGLDTKLVTNAIQMIDANVGYLAGCVPNVNAGVGGFRGYLYQTTDGGNNWSRIENLNNADLVKVRMITVSEGFAVGNNGTALRTLDGGSTWDILNTHLLPITSNFIDIAVKSATSAAFLLGNGQIVKYSSGTVTLINPNYSALFGTFSQAITLKEYGLATANTYLISCNFINGIETYGQTGMVDITASTPTVSVENLVGSTWNNVRFAVSDIGSIAGIDGDVAYIDGVNSRNYLTSSSSNVGNIVESYFLDRNFGVALIADQNNDTYLYKTNDSGKIWSLVYTSKCNSIVLVKTNVGSSLSIAASFVDRLFYYNFSPTATTTYWNTVNQYNIEKISVHSDALGYAIVGIQNLVIYRSGLFTSTGTVAPSFVFYYELPISGGTFSKMLSHVESSTLHVVGIRSSTKIVVDVYKIGSTATTLVNVSPSSTTFADIAIGTIGGKYLMAYEITGKKLYRYNLLTTSPVAGSLSGYGNSLPSNVTVIGAGLRNYLISSTESEQLFLVGLNGIIYKSNTLTKASTSVIWTDVSIVNGHIARSISNNDSPLYSTYAVGDNGIALRRIKSSNSWEVVPLKQTANLRTISAANVTYSSTTTPCAVIGGTNGVAFNWNLNTNANSIIPISGTSFTGVFTDVSLVTNNLGIGYLYIVGSGLGMDGYSAFTSNFMPLGNNTLTRSSLNLIGANPSVSAAPAQTGVPKAFVVSALGNITQLLQTNQTSIKAVFGPALNNIHFADANVGTAVGNNFSVYKTTNAGITWEIILPSILNTTTLTRNIREVTTKKIGTNIHFALLGGTSYLAKTHNGATATDVDLTFSPSDIQFASASITQGFMSSGSSIYNLNLTSSSSGYNVAISTVANIGSQVNAIQAMADGGLFAVGNNLVKYKAPSVNTFIDIRNGISGNFKDICFIDNQHGYLVGDNNTFYKTDQVQVHPTSHNVQSVSWLFKNITDSYISNSSLIVNINAVEMASTNRLVFGGQYVSYPNPIIAPVRTLLDEFKLFSAYFYYDCLGRIVTSQNGRQFLEDKYSYTLYDAIGRVYEAGEKDENTISGSLQFADVFGTDVGGQFITSVIDDTKLYDWVETEASSTRFQVTRSYYDKTNSNIDNNGLNNFVSLNTETQRKRIVHVSYEEEYDGVDATYDHATHYDYDIHGNVEMLIQDNKSLGNISDLVSQRFKKMEYTYDLISGNVHQVDYQSGKADQWHHAYIYDADNRIEEVYTSTATPITTGVSGIAAMINEAQLSPYWDRDATYRYYDHGPLARTELGEHEVQGNDYVYTLQGWIKGVNSNSLNSQYDPGKDGDAFSLNQKVARDVYGYSLTYFTGDYASISGVNADQFQANLQNSDIEASRRNLYNGNIGAMVTTITNPNNRAILPLGNVYEYDQLNRLNKSKSYDNFNFVANSWNIGGQLKYYNAFTFDANGNIRTQIRKDGTNQVIDDLTYNYHKNSDNKTIRNRLYSVNDAVTSNAYTDDIDDMSLFVTDGQINTINNYVYDAEGRLIKDKQEDIEKIVWRVDGKVKKIIRPISSQKKNLSFDYDAMGNRIAKHVMNANNSLEKSTYYVLDAQGNTMSVYDRVVDNEAQSISFVQAEKHMYGSSRLGVLNTGVPLLGTQNATYKQTIWSHTIGQRNYELANHLGNVLSVISDKPIPHSIGTGIGSSIDYFMSDIQQSTDYSGFGVQLNGRNFTKAGAKEFRYGYQGSEADDEIKGEGNSYTTFFRQLDPRLGRWFSIDPKATAWESPYVSMGNSPIQNNDKMGDTVRKTDAFKGNAAYMKAYTKFENSDAGKAFLKDYEIGGKYEHISVVFDLADKGTAGVGGGTFATAMPKSKKNEPIDLGSATKVINANSLISNKIPDYYVRFTIEMNPNVGGEVSELNAVDDGASLLHEIQHVVLGTLGLYDKNISRIPSSTNQHETMRDENQHYYWDRVNYWWQYTPIWYHDFLNDKKQSLEDAKDKNPSHYHKTIFKGTDYINEKDTFLNN